MSRKKKLLGGLAVVAVAALIGLGYWRMVQNNVQPMTVAPELEESDYAGETGSCQPVDEHQWYRSDNTLTINHADPNTLGIFIEKRGFFKTTDGGQTWTYSSKGVKGLRGEDTYKDRPCYLEFRVSVVDPTNPQRILVGLLGDLGDIESPINQAGGLLETLDGGKTWHQLLKPGMNAYVHDIAIDPSNPQTIYYITSSQKPQHADKALLTKGLIYKTTDGGKNWVELNTGLGENVGGQELYINPANPQQLLATTLAFGYPTEGGGRQPASEPFGILVSTDAGATWTRSQPLPGSDENTMVSSVSPTNFNNMYLQSWTESQPRAYYSTDGGKNWRRSAMAMDLVAYDPTVASGREAFGYAWQTGQKVLYHTTDAGATWHVVGTLPTDITNLQDPKQRISKIVIDPSNHNTIYLAGAGATVWKSTDLGKTWVRVLSLDTLP